MHPGYERMIPKLTSNRNLRSAKTVLGDDGSVRAHLTRERIDDLELLDARIKQVTTEIEAKVKDSGTTLTQLTGVSFVLAGRILGEVGDVRRLGSKASFAMLNGTAPLEASSGNTRRHRLNRTGNRKLNFVLHRMAIVCLRVDDDSREYVARKLAEGKSKEALRCLKRQLSNVVHRQLLRDMEHRRGLLDNIEGQQARRALAHRLRLRQCRQRRNKSDALVSTDGIMKRPRWRESSHEIAGSLSFRFRRQPHLR